LNPGDGYNYDHQAPHSATLTPEFLYASDRPPQNYIEVEKDQTPVTQSAR
jgi:hypothetical protein